jgi:hypothetical protein
MTELTKGEERKLKALQKSIGDDLGQNAFDLWMDQQAKEKALKNSIDHDAALIESTLYALVQEKRLHIQRGGYLVKQGRGRVIVEPMVKE